MTIARRMTYLEQLFAGSQVSANIDDTSTAIDKLWSASKLDTLFAAMPTTYAGLNSSVSFTAIALAGVDLATVLAAKANLNGGTFTGKINTLASSAAGGAGLNIPAGVAPTTPANGDVWLAAGNLLQYRSNAATFTVGSTGISQSWAGTQTFSVLTATGAVTLSGATTASSTVNFSKVTATTLAAYGAFMIGTAAGANVAYDLSSIQARNNGVAANLNLQPLGGNVVIPAGGMLTVGGVNVSLVGHTHVIADVTGLQGQLDGINTAIGTKVNSSLVGAANGLAQLDASGTVPAAQLPSYVDDVLEYANQAAFPGTGTTGKIYVALDTNKTYRWSGTVYIEISASPGTTDALAEGSVNLYFTNARAVSALTATLANYAGLGGATYTGKVVTVASAAGAAGLNVPHGAAPTAPVNGDLWTLTTGLQVRINGVTQTAGMLGLAQTWTGNQTFSGNNTYSGTSSFTNGLTATSTVNFSRVTATTLAAYGAFMIGTATAANVAYDLSSIQARNNGAAATLQLNPLGGAVTVGGSLTTAGQLSALGATHTLKDAAGTTTFATFDVNGITAHGLLPDADGTRNSGSATARWNNFYGMTGVFSTAVTINGTDVMTAINGKQAHSTVLDALAGLTLTGNAGLLVTVNATGDGFIFTTPGSGGGGTLTDRDYGDVAVSGTGTVMKVESAQAGFTIAGTNVMTAIAAKLDASAKAADSAKADVVTFADTRTINDAPQDFAAHTLRADFKNTGSVGSPTINAGNNFAYILTATAWQGGGAGAGGQNAQISIGDGLAVRQATGLTTWGPWRNVWHDGTFDPTTKLGTAGGTLTGQVISTLANNTANGGGQIFLNGATGNRIDFNGNGVAGPTFTTRSVGTKIVLYPNITSGTVDYGFGIEATALWCAVANNTVGFKWYAGTSAVMTLSGTGNLTLTGTTLTVNGTDLVAAINGKVASTLLGAANGVATLDATGKVPSTQLPSYVDDVLEYVNLASFPATGTAGIIYVADDTGKIYRWSGSAYINIAASPGSTDAVVEGTTNLYFTNARAIAAPLTGYVVGANSAIVATDSIVAAFGKAQGQISANASSITTNTTNIANHIGSGGGAHAVVVAGGANGFMTGADKSKLDGIAAGATANTAAATFNTSGTGDASGTAFDGTVARTISYNTVGAAPAFSAVQSISANATLADATHNNGYLKLTGAAALTITADATPTAGFTCVIVNRGTVAMTIVCAGGYYKNGAAATATTNLSLAAGGRLTAFHEGAGIWTFDGTGF